MTVGAQETIDNAMSEAELQRNVVAHLKQFGYRYYHTRYSLGSTGGFPDLFAVKPGRALAIELKSQKGKLTGEQEVWLHDLGLAGVETHVWRPSDLSSGIVERVLRGVGP